MSEWAFSPSARMICRATKAAKGQASRLHRYKMSSGACGSHCVSACKRMAISKIRFIFFLFSHIFNAFSPVCTLPSYLFTNEHVLRFVQIKKKNPKKFV